MIIVIESNYQLEMSKAKVCLKIKKLMIQIPI